MAFTFKLVTIDGTPAAPSQFTTVAPQWKPGDTIPLAPAGRSVSSAFARPTSTRRRC
jgi:hypothetical protein